MQITLNLDETIVEQLKTEADRRGTTASALASAGILRILGEARPKSPADETTDPLPELPKWRGGRELVDISNREELYRVMDEYDGFRY